MGNVNQSNGTPDPAGESINDPDTDPIATADFRVDAFVPDRLAVDLGPVPGPLLPGRPFTLPVIARFLYGAPGEGLSGRGTRRKRKRTGRTRLVVQEPRAVDRQHEALFYQRQICWRAPYKKPR